MLKDLTVLVTSSRSGDALENERMASFGHLGTHFDVMNKTFPLEFVSRKGIIFDVSAVCEREIEVTDIDIRMVKPDMFVAFYTGFIETESYGSKAYFDNHPQLAFTLIEELIRHKISIIGIDFAGMRRGKEHTPADQFCADHGVFVVENLCRLSSVLNGAANICCVIHTYPIHFAGLTGLPCRVVAELTD